MDNVRIMCPDDVLPVVDTHQRAFNGFFLSSMGTSFLWEFYYSVLQDDTHIAFVCHNAGRVLGFVVGTTHPAGFYRRTIQRNWVRFVLASIPVLLKRPMIVTKLLRRLDTARSAVFQNGQALLLSIASHPDVQGRGIGHVLVSAFLRESGFRGCQSVCLTTDAVGNELVNKFYMREGFTLGEEFVTAEGRRMNKYIRVLNEFGE